MSRRMKPILGALVVGVILNLAGIQYVFGPALANDTPPGAMMPWWASVVIGMVLIVLFYDWVAQTVGRPVTAAMIIAVSQILLVDVYYVLNGTRGLAAAAASAAVLLVAWGGVGLTYGKLSASPATHRPADPQAVSSV